MVLKVTDLLRPSLQIQEIHGESGTIKPGKMIWSAAHFTCDADPFELTGEFPDLTIDCDGERWVFMNVVIALAGQSDISTKRNQRFSAIFDKCCRV